MGFILRLQFFQKNLLFFFLFEGDAFGELVWSGWCGMCELIESFVIDYGIAFAFLPLFRKGELFVYSKRLIVVSDFRNTQDVVVFIVFIVLLLLIYYVSILPLQLRHLSILMNYRSFAMFTISFEISFIARTICPSIQPETMLHIVLILSLITITRFCSWDP